MPSKDWWHDEARDLDRPHAAAILAAYKDTFRTGIQPALESLKAQIEAKEASGQKVPVSWYIDQDRLRQINYQVSMKLAEFKPLVLQEVMDSKTEAVALAERATGDMVGSLSSVPPGVLEEIVGTAADGSTPLGELIDSFDLDVGRGIRRELVNHAILGRSVDETVRELRHQIGMPLTRALTIVRTETARAYTNASLASYRANPALVWGWEWLTAEDERVCEYCGPLAGSTHEASEDMETHPNCRCAVSPITMDEALERGLLDEQPTEPEPEPEPEPVVEPEVESPFPKDADDAMTRVQATWDEYGARIDDINRQIYGATGGMSEVYDLRIKRAQLESDRLDAMRAHLHVQDPLELRAFAGNNPINAHGARQVIRRTDLEELQAGLDEFGKYVSASKFPMNDGDAVPVYHTSRGRSFQYEGAIYMNPHASQDVIVHEMGHVLETNNPDLMQRSYDYMKSQATSSQAKNRPGYEKNEWFYEGRYFDPYVGKEYWDPSKQAPFATEVLSMGLQYYHKDPLMLAQNDPDLFRYIWEATR